MMGLSGGLPRTMRTSLFLFFSFSTIIVGTSGQSCASNLALPSSVTKLGVITDRCEQVPVAGASPSATYNLWYKLDNSTSPNTLSVILSVPRESQARWYGMGFNAQMNSMKFTSAIIFWLSPTGSAPKVGTYYLSDASIGGVNPDNSRLTFTSGKTPQVVADTNNLYLAFEVNETTVGMFAYQNFVMGQPGDVPSGDVISGQTQHQGESSVKIDFRTGSTVITTVNLDGRRRTHGILNIIGWGVLLPIGAIVARHARAFDPHWFYVHAFFQIVGYGFILAGLITGTKLLDLLPGIDASDHKALGILVFVLASVQISAVLIRPKREAKLRRYWNWGHWWVGRVALVIGAVNIFVGIHLAKASRKWKVGYGIVLGLELFAVVVLEILLWANYARSKNEPDLPQTAMPNRNSNGASAPPPPYETSWDGKP